ncbi:MAG: helix-turn-helix transcriptional regulator [Clostridia bacterium]|nr:helix-turn-helix transcriptional regulator [Clostridia bacterium]
MFSQNLKRLRENSDISQTRFSQDIGFSQAAISAWENNTREPGIVALIKIAQYFNVSVDYLIGRKDQNNETKLTPNEKELLDIFNSLEKEYKAQILEYARYFKERTKNMKRG